MMKRTLRTVGSTLLLTFSALAVGMAKDEAKPNIVVIYADDIGYGDFSCYGGTGAATPFVDSLAETGVRFLSAYSSSATCTPSRYSLLTGEYAFRREGAEILPGDAPLLIDVNQPTLPKSLQKAGYATGFVGKWHLGLGSATEPSDWNREITPGPREVGFDYTFHIAATGDRVPSVYIEDGYVVNLDQSDPIRVSYLDPVGDEPTGISHPEELRLQADTQHSGTIVNGVSRIGWMEGGHSARFNDETMADTFLGKAVEFIDSKKEEPFFLYFATHDNHVPRLPHPRFQGSSSLGPRGDAIVQFDWIVGKLVEELETRGLRENTLIILTSDNGPVLFDGYSDGAYELNGEHRPAGPYQGSKYSRWEGGTRMPFIVSWPNRVQPGISDALISQVDLFASLGSLIGMDAEEVKGLDSENILPALLGESAHGRDSLLQEALKQHALREGDWKYIPAGPISVRDRHGAPRKTKIPEPGLLFHLVEDPGETRDLSKVYPEKLKEMKRHLASIKRGD